MKRIDLPLEQDPLLLRAVLNVCAHRLGEKEGGELDEEEEERQFFGT